MGMNSSNGNNKHLMSEINVTPFVDVMLVLLVIFMVTAPILYQGVNVNLPKTSSQPVPDVSSSKNMIVTVDKDGKIYIEKQECGLNELRVKIRSFVKKSGKPAADQEIFLRADQDVPYGSVMEVMSNIRGAGIEKVGLITEPLLEEKLQ